jgi:predicted enzyme related to lactoylglutathione lyase
MTVKVHAYIGVTDLERGIAFYCQAVGLSLRRRLDDNWVELAGASIPIFLLTSERPEQRPGYWTAHLDFLTDDLEAAERRAREAGAVLVRDLQERIWGRMANMVDAFGNPFDFIELASDGYDRIQYPKPSR